MQLPGATTLHLVYLHRDSCPQCLRNLKAVAAAAARAAVKVGAARAAPLMPLGGGVDVVVGVGIAAVLDPLPVGSGIGVPTAEDVVFGPGVDAVALEAVMIVGGGVVDETRDEVDVGAAQKLSAVTCIITDRAAFTQ